MRRKIKNKFAPHHRNHAATSGGPFFTVITFLLRWLFPVASKTSKGMVVILAPPGTGKSTWAKSHNDWHDMDLLYRKLHDVSWHRKKTTAAEEAEHYRKIDAAVTRDRDRLNIVGSLFWDLIPDAIVLLPERVHRNRVAARPGLSWRRAHAVARHLLQLAKKHNVPIFRSFDVAAKAVACDCDK